MNKLFFLITAFLVSSCAINYKMPDNRFMTPETRGGYGKVALITGYGQGKSIELTPDYSQSWANTQTPLIKDTGFFTIGGNLGLLERLDVGLKYVFDVGIVGTVKFQPIGKSGEKGLHLALAATAGGGSETKSESNNTPTKAELSNSFFGGDIVLGYRFSESFLFYVSAFRDRASYDLIQTRGTVTRNIDGHSENTGGTVGAQLNLSKTSSLLVEAARGEAVSAHSKSTSTSFGGLLTIGLF